jgi:Fe-S cluster assembly iron-binding protein IscA
MLEVTERAKQELKKILSANTDEPSACLRLTANEQGQLGLSIDVERDGDQAIEHEDSKVLLVEKELADALEGITIDAEDTPEGTKLVVSSEA